MPCAQGSRPHGPSCSRSRAEPSRGNLSAMTEEARVHPLLSADTIGQRVRELGAAITRDYQGKELLLVSVLKGSFVFAADLARAIDLPCAIEFLGLKSYGSSKATSGVVQITSDLTHPIANKHVLIVEDIVDTGLTMAYLIKNLETRGPSSIRLCSLLHKPARAKVPTV